MLGTLDFKSLEILGTQLLLLEHRLDLAFKIAETLKPDKYFKVFLYFVEQFSMRQGQKI